MGRIGPYICSPCHDYRSGKSPATEFHLLELPNVDKFRLTGARSSEGPGVQHRPVNVWTFGAVQTVLVLVPTVEPDHS